MFEVIIIWKDGDKNLHTFERIEDAMECINNYRFAFGNQIAFSGINDRR